MFHHDENHDFRWKLPKSVQNTVQWQKHEKQWIFDVFSISKIIFLEVSTQNLFLEATSNQVQGRK